MYPVVLDRRWLAAVHGAGWLGAEATAAQHSAVLNTVVVSIIVHGMSVTPVMRRYRSRQPAPRRGRAAES
ncbi:MAG: hypothetical protein ABI901_09125 [Roseiflexaceae bacterium]